MKERGMERSLDAVPIQELGEHRPVRAVQHKIGNPGEKEQEEFQGTTLYLQKKKNRDLLLSTVRPVHDKKKLCKIIR